MVSAMFPLKLHQVLVRRRGKTVIGPVDLELGPQGATMIVGPNGSGKTTLLRVMHGIERISSGSVQWEDDDPAKHAFVFQSPVVLRRTVVQNLAYPLELLKLPKLTVKTSVAEWLGRIGLQGKADMSATRLSGGERQRVAVARALVMNPPLILADEPTGNLDPATGDQVAELLFEMNRTRGTTLVVVTHSKRMADQLGRVLVLSGGQLHEGDAGTAVV